MEECQTNFLDFIRFKVQFTSLKSKLKLVELAQTTYFRLFNAILSAT